MKCYKTKIKGNIPIRVISYKKVAGKEKAYSMFINGKDRLLVVKAVCQGY